MDYTELREQDSRLRQSKSGRYAPVHAVISTADLIAAGTTGVSVLCGGADDIVIYSSIAAVIEYDGIGMRYTRTLTEQGAGAQVFSTTQFPRYRITEPVDRITVRLSADHALGRHGHVYIYGAFRERFETVPLDLKHLPHHAAVTAGAVTTPGTSTTINPPNTLFDVGGRTPTDVWLTEVSINLTDAANVYVALGANGVVRATLFKSDAPAGDLEALLVLRGQPVNNLGTVTPMCLATFWHPVHLPLKDLLDTRSGSAGALQWVIAHSTPMPAGFWNIFYNFYYQL